MSLTFLSGKNIIYHLAATHITSSFQSWILSPTVDSSKLFTYTITYKLQVVQYAKDHRNRAAERHFRPLLSRKWFSSTGIICASCLWVNSTKIMADEHWRMKTMISECVLVWTWLYVRQQFWFFFFFFLLFLEVSSKSGCSFQDAASNKPQNTAYSAGNSNDEKNRKRNIWKGTNSNAHNISLPILVPLPCYPPSAPAQSPTRTHRGSASSNGAVLLKDWWQLGQTLGGGLWLGMLVHGHLCRPLLCLDGDGGNLCRKMATLLCWGEKRGGRVNLGFRSSPPFSPNTHTSLQGTG